MREAQMVYLGFKPGRRRLSEVWQPPMLTILFVSEILERCRQLRDEWIKEDEERFGSGSSKGDSLIEFCW